MRLVLAAGLPSPLPRSGCCCSPGRCSHTAAAHRRRKGSLKSTEWRRRRSRRNTTPSPGWWRWTRAIDTSSLSLQPGFARRPRSEPSRAAHLQTRLVGPHLQLPGPDAAASLRQDEQRTEGKLYWALQSGTVIGRRGTARTRCGLWQGAIYRSRVCPTPRSPWQGSHRSKDDDVLSLVSKSYFFKK